MLLRRATGQGPKQIIELYTVEVSDVQGFIERKQHIFNFYLMDKLFDLPDPKAILILEEEKQRANELQQQQKKLNQEGTQREANNGGHGVDGQQQHQENASSASTTDFNVEQDCVEVVPNVSRQHNTGSSSVAGSATTTSLVQEEKEDLMEVEEDVMAHRQAQQLVDDMFTAVKSIGRKARKRGSLAAAMVEHRAHLTSKLKEFQGTKNKSASMQEGVKVIQRVGKAVAKKTKGMQTVMPKMPPRRQGEEVPIFVRVGRVIVEDARIFTRTSTNGPGKRSSATSVDSGKAGGGDSIKEPEQPTEEKPPLDDLSDGSSSFATGLGSKWNKPIGVSEFVLRSSELCPPNSLVDENGLPAIYQPVDKILDVILKRALVGLAQSNTNRFMQTVSSQSYHYLDFESGFNTSAESFVAY